MIILSEERIFGIGFINSAGCLLLGDQIREIWRSILEELSDLSLADDGRNLGWVAAEHIFRRETEFEPLLKLWEDSGLPAPVDGAGSDVLIGISRRSEYNWLEPLETLLLATGIGWMWLSTMMRNWICA